MKRLTRIMVFGFSLLLLASGFAAAANDSKVKGATEQVKSGAVDTAKGIGGTVSEGAKYTGANKGFFTNLFSG